MSKTATELGPLQQAVMEYAWEHPGCSVRDCRDALAQAQGKEHAYTTIQTVFDALHASACFRGGAKKTPSTTRRAEPRVISALVAGLQETARTAWDGAAASGQFTGGRAWRAATVRNCAHWWLSLKRGGM